MVWVCVQGRRGGKGGSKREEGQVTQNGAGGVMKLSTCCWVCEVDRHCRVMCPTLLTGAVQKKTTHATPAAPHTARPQLLCCAHDKRSPATHQPPVSAAAAPHLPAVFDSQVRQCITHKCTAHGGAPINHQHTTIARTLQGLVVGLEGGGRGGGGGGGGKYQML